MGRQLGDIFPKTEECATDQYLERFSMSLITREIQIKATIRYHLTAVTMAIIKKISDNKC